MKASDITPLITAIADNEENTAAEVRAVLLKIRDAIYPTSTPTDVHTGSAQTFSVPSDPTKYGYQITLTADGIRVFVDGFLQNLTGNPISGVTFLVLKDNIAGSPSIYLPSTEIDPSTTLPVIYRGAAEDLYGNRVRVLIMRDNAAGASILRISGNMSGYTVTDSDGVNRGSKHYFTPAMSYNAKS